MKLYDEGAYEWLSSIAVGGTGADQQIKEISPSLVILKIDIL